jgi:ubiquinone/menaquinone biosynthesis C-methylase UbiE
MEDAGSVIGLKTTAKAQTEAGQARDAKTIHSARSKSTASSEGGETAQVGCGSGRIWLLWKASVGRNGQCNMKA